MNTAFLQLTRGNFEGKLSLDVRQFHEACNGHGPDWVKKHDACLLMTHHPPGWLTEEGKRHMDEEIYSSPERFVLHLYGHMHESRLTSLSEGGANPRCRLQGLSLFGMEGWGTSKEAHRLHGYSLGQLSINDTKGEIRIYPRKAEKKSDGWKIERDLGFSLPRGEDSTIPYTVELQRLGNDLNSFTSAEVMEGNHIQVLSPKNKQVTEETNDQSFSNNSTSNIRQKRLEEDRNDTHLPSANLLNQSLDKSDDVSYSKLNVIDQEKILALVKQLDNLIVFLESLDRRLQQQIALEFSTIVSIRDLPRLPESLSEESESYFRRKQVWLSDIDRIDEISPSINKNLAKILARTTWLEYHDADSFGYKNHVKKVVYIVESIKKDANRLRRIYQKILFKIRS